MLRFFSRAFSDGDQPSSSRLIMYQHSVAVCACLLFLVYKNHAFPDPLTMAAAGAFVGVSYAVNRFSQKPSDSRAPNANPSA